MRVGSMICIGPNNSQYIVKAYDVFTDQYWIIKEQCINLDSNFFPRPYTRYKDSQLLVSVINHTSLKINMKNPGSEFEDVVTMNYNIDIKTKDLEKYARIMLDDNRDWSDIYLAMQNEVNELAKHMQSDPTLVMFSILDKAKRE